MAGQETGSINLPDARFSGESRPLPHHGLNTVLNAGESSWAQLTGEPFNKR
jgi:hypothetical protein